MADKVSRYSEYFKAVKKERNVLSAELESMREKHKFCIRLGEQEGLQETRREVSALRKQLDAAKKDLKSAMEENEGSRDTYKEAA